MSRPRRVVQWTTGKRGRAAARAGVGHSQVIEVGGDPSFRRLIEPGEGWNGAQRTANLIVNAILSVWAALPAIVNVGSHPFVGGAHAIR